jgi:predicted ABC-type ATPase
MQDQRPFVVVIAGPNGSGKSSLTRLLQAQDYDLGRYINPDEIAAGLSGAYDARVREAQAIADVLRAEAIAEQRSFSFETVFSHPSKLNVLEQAHNAGFETILFFVAVDDPLINVERVNTRVSLGGHDVPADRIVSRYSRAMALLPEMLARIDRGWIFDNSVHAADPAAFAGQLVATVEGGFDKSVVIKTRRLLPVWVVQHLIEPARKKGWKTEVIGGDDLRCTVDE